MTLYSTAMRRAELCRLKVQRHRQSAHADSHSPRQGPPRPRRALESQAAGDPARLLALDAAQHLSVSRHRQRSARRRAHQCQHRLVSLPASRSKGRHHQTPFPTQSAAQLRHPSAGSRRRPAHHPGPARSFPTGAHPALPASVAQHLQAIPNPLDALQISSLDDVKRSRRLQKK